MLMELNEVKKYLPQRYPFLFIDRVVELEENDFIVCIKCVTGNEGFFQGHFPEVAIMPGVLMIEAVAQACGILGFKSTNRTPDDGTTYLLAGVDNVRFKRKVIPGDQLVIKAMFKSKRRGIWKFSGEASVDGELALSVDLLVAEREI